MTAAMFLSSAAMRNFTWKKVQPEIILIKRAARDKEIDANSSQHDEVSTQIVIERARQREGERESERESMSSARLTRCICHDLFILIYVQPSD